MLCLVWGGAWSGGGVPGAGGNGVPGPGGPGIPACTEADTPPLWTDTHL